MWQPCPVWRCKRWRQLWGRISEPWDLHAKRPVPVSDPLLGPSWWRVLPHESHQVCWSLSSTFLLWSWWRIIFIILSLLFWSLTPGAMEQSNAQEERMRKNAKLILSLDFYWVRTSLLTSSSSSSAWPSSTYYLLYFFSVLFWIAHCDHPLLHSHSWMHLWGRKGWGNYLVSFPFASKSSSRGIDAWSEKL